MTAGEERETLGALADRLCAEFGFPPAHEGDGGTGSALTETSVPMFAERPSVEDERLVATARRTLVRIAAALETRHPRAVSDTAYRALFDGAEFVMRTELAAGNSISALMPSLVFLISLPMVNHDEALELSRRSTALLEETTG